MKVQFISNLGSRDAAHFDLDFTKCLAGSIHDLPNDVAADLLKFTRDGVPSPLVREVKDTPEVAAATETFEQFHGKSKTEAAPKVLSVEPKK